MQSLLLKKSRLKPPSLVSPVFIFILSLTLFFLLFFYFCLCLCLSKGERSPQTALSRAKRPSLSLFLSLFLSLSLSLCLSLFFLCLCFSKYLTSRRPLPCQETGRVRFRCNKLERTKWGIIKHWNYNCNCIFTFEHIFTSPLLPVSMPQVFSRGSPPRYSNNPVNNAW